MKLAPREAGTFLARRDPACPGILIFGEDVMRVAMRRAALLEGWLGPEAEAEMRIARIAAAEARRDPAAVNDALRATGFFAGPRAVLVEDAGDALAPLLATVLQEWREGDATLVVTAGMLPSRSALRKLFEGDRRARALAVYSDPPGRAEVEEELRRAGTGPVDEAGMRDLLAIAAATDPAELRQIAGKLALYRLGAQGAAGPEDVAACAPVSTEAALDDVLDAVFEGRPHALGPLMGRLAAQGTTPVTLCIAAQRHVRRLHAAASHPGGAEAGVGALRPPVWGPGRERVLRQARRLPRARAEQALALLIDCDLDLRSSRPFPAHALVERCLMRIAHLSRDERK
ncbi:MAG: DNA polymerase III subunit delta [Rhodobacteraceae bacterium]|nr:DNA polymerase III subunit delta [Paracoccaceae bacterium]